MNESEFAAKLADQLRDDMAGDEELGVISNGGPYVLVRLGPLFGADAGTQFLLTVTLGDVLPTTTALAADPAPSAATTTAATGP